MMWILELVLHLEQLYSCPIHFMSFIVWCRNHVFMVQMVTQNYVCPFFSSVPDPPMIDLSQSRVYNEGLIQWRLPEDSLPTDHHVLEYRKVPAKDEESHWHQTERVYSPSTVVCDLDSDCHYAFRVRSCRSSIHSPYSPEVSFHTPPAPGKWTLSWLII